MPRLMIIQAASYRGYGDRRPLKIRKRRLVGAVMPYLAALAPREWDVTLVDDAVEEVDFNAPVDVVAITARMVTSLRAYELADKFRDRGVTVLMGGLMRHSTATRWRNMPTVYALAKPKRFFLRCCRTPRRGG